VRIWSSGNKNSGDKNRLREATNEIMAFWTRFANLQMRLDKFFEVPSVGNCFYGRRVVTLFMLEWTVRPN
jgi:hypothetical protein